jgi:hypothetical protein
MANNEEPIQSSEFKDKKTGLVAFGVIQIIFGGFAALAIPFMILGMLVSTALGKNSSAPISIRMSAPSVLFYVVLAVWFIWMGIGSIKARRWARALILVSSWLWLICGIGGLIFMLLFLPGMYDQMAKNIQMPPADVSIMIFIMIGFMTIFYVVIPAVFVLFYKSKNVKATCEFSDPQVRWTDKCPLPVLAVSFIFTTWTASMLFMGFYKWTIPFFGFIASGLTGAAVVLIVMFISAYLAWGTYKLSMKAWWCSLFLIIAWALSTGITFSRVSIWDLYEKMSFPKEQMSMKQLGWLNAFTIVLFVGLWSLALLAYLLYIRRYFVHPPTQENPFQQTSI